MEHDLIGKPASTFRSASSVPAPRCRRRRAPPNWRASPQPSRPYRCRGRRLRRRKPRNPRAGRPRPNSARRNRRRGRPKIPAYKPRVTQIADQAGRRAAVVLVERRVGIDRARHALAQHQRRMRNVERRMKLGAGASLHAVVGPQQLRTVGRRNGLERLFAGMASKRRKSARPDANPASARHCETVRRDD